VSWTKTLLYSYLEEIYTARKEKRKGFGQKLLVYLEKNAKAHGATTMKTVMMTLALVKQGVSLEAWAMGVSQLRMLR
jgi:GNAT superfamily N-acetyltransferase